MDGSHVVAELNMSLSWYYFIPASVEMPPSWVDGFQLASCIRGRPSPIHVLRHLLDNLDDIGNLEKSIGELQNLPQAHQNDSLENGLCDEQFCSQVPISADEVAILDTISPKCQLPTKFWPAFQLLTGANGFRPLRSIPPTQAGPLPSPSFQRTRVPRMGGGREVGVGDVVRSLLTRKKRRRERGIARKFEGSGS